MSACLAEEELLAFGRGESGRSRTRDAARALHRRPRPRRRRAVPHARPPPLGLESVDSLVMRGDGSLYAYSYGSELSQLFLTELPA
jgi:hypothetical protein